MAAEILLCFKSKFDQNQSVNLFPNNYFSIKNEYWYAELSFNEPLKKTPHIICGFLLSSNWVFPCTYLVRT